MAEVGENRSAFGIPLLIGAVGFGLAAAALSYLYLKSEEAALIEKYAGKQGKPVTMLVAKQDIRKGTILRQELLSQRKIPRQYAHADAIAAAEYQRYLGRTIEVNLAAGKPLLKSFLDDGFAVDFSDTVPVGRRAMTVQVDDVNSIAGFMRPGNRVDLFVNIPSGFSGFSAGFITADLVDEIPGELREAIPEALLEAAAGANTDNADIQSLLGNALPKDVILPVLQNVRVLATGRDPYREQLDQLNYPQPRAERNFSTITIDVLPREAALITAALDKGEILMILRNRDDEGAADFSTLSAQDLFSNAFAMAEAAAEQRSRVKAAAGVDVRGNLVDADGKTLMTREQLEAAGLTVNENGELVDKDGNVVDAKDLVVTADGRVVNKKALAAAGLSVNASGQIVDADGNVVAPEDIVVAADGKVMTREQLASAGLTVNERGEIVDSSGRVIDSSEIVTTADGRVLTKSQLEKAGMAVDANGNIVNVTKASVAAGVDGAGNLVDASGKTLMTREQLAAAGLTVNEKGQLVNADGEVIDPADVVVTADGRVMTKQQLAASGLSVNEDGVIVDASGKAASITTATVAAGVDASGNLVDANGNTLMSAAQLAAAGYTVNEKGEIVDASGKVVNPADLVVTSDGRVVTKQELAEQGISIGEGGVLVDASGKPVSATVDPAQLAVSANGEVISNAALAKAGLTRNKNGQIVDAEGRIVDPSTLVTDANGNIIDREQLAAAGLTVNERGEVVDKDGNVIDPSTLVVTKNGVVSEAQLKAAGLSVDADGNVVDASGRQLSAAEVAKVVANTPIGGGSRRVDLIIGGSSKDGVAKSTTLKVTE